MIATLFAWLAGSWIGKALEVRDEVGNLDGAGVPHAIAEININ